MNMIMGVAIKTITHVTADPAIMDIIRHNKPKRSPQIADMTDKVSANGTSE